MPRAKKELPYHSQLVYTCLVCEAGKPQYASDSSTLVLEHIKTAHNMPDLNPAVMVPRTKEYIHMDFTDGGYQTSYDCEWSLDGKPVLMQGKTFGRWEEQK